MLLDYIKPGITEKQIAKAYQDIKSGMTLTQVAKSYKRTRDFIKGKILDFIKDEEEKREFLDLLRINQHPRKKDEFLELSEAEKKKIVFERLNRRRTFNNRDEYSGSFLEKKYARLKTYFLETRNQTIKNGEKILEEDFFKILYDTPTLLSSSLTNKIIPAVENLDNHPDIGTESTNKILRADASILCSSIPRTNLQIRMLKANELLENFMLKPRNFRTSPELLYALIELHRDKKVKETSIFITKTKLERDYGMTPEKLMKKYDIKEKYGDDEYFKEDR